VSPRTITPEAPVLPGSETAERLEALTRRLRLPYVRATAAEVLPTARSQRWDPAEVLVAVLDAEAAGRDRATITARRRAARFPSGKTFYAWRETDSSIPLPTQQALRSLEWVTRAENLVICGPSGTGKSHFAEAIGHACIDAGLTVAWFSIEDLGALVRRHRPDDSLGRAIRRICRANLLIVDDIGLLPVSPEAAEGLYRLVDAAYEQRSIALSSNLHPAGFDELMPRTLATATVDRLLHHAHLCQTSGDSYRLAQATTGKGVTPLD